MLRNVLIVVLLISFFSCKEKEEKKEINKTESAEAIIEKSIKIAGGQLLNHAEINFDFRDIHYTAVRDYGKFRLERRFKDSISEIKDVLGNSGFERFRDGKEVQLEDSIAKKFSASVNSVHYFSVLPYGLDGKAVNKKYLGSKEIKGKDYHKIKVTFSEDGGGEDFEDEFIYWIDKDLFTVDYLSYTYKEEDGQGYRFREAYNEREINGIRFTDYDNYQPTSANVTFENLDDLFINGELQLLSKIELKNIEVKILN